LRRCELGRLFRKYHHGTRHKITFSLRLFSCSIEVMKRSVPPTTRFRDATPLQSRNFADIHNHAITQVPDRDNTSAASHDIPIPNHLPANPYMAGLLDIEHYINIIQINPYKENLKLRYGHAIHLQNLINKQNTESTFEGRRLMGEAITRLQEFIVALEKLRHFTQTIVVRHRDLSLLPMIFELL
jgi:hypothetical protein